MKKINQQNNYNQIPLDQNYLKALVSTFFGKYPNTFSKKMPNMKKHILGFIQV